MTILPKNTYIAILNYNCNLLLALGLVENFKLPSFSLNRI